MAPGDWPALRDILQEGIADGIATLDTAVPGQAEWDRSHLSECRIVAREGDTVLGWAALSRVSDRHCYRGVAEVSIYVAGAARGRGVGRALMESLVDCSESHGFWTLQSAVFPENAVSIALHESCGFRSVGVRERIGEQDGSWRDILLMERRSGVVAAPQ
jgi:phosphinothricin acetyltransferase